MSAWALDNDLWGRIVGHEFAKEQSWSQWASYFTKNYPNELAGVNLIDRFNNFDNNNTHTNRLGLLFATTAQGNNIPVGLMVAHEDADHHFESGHFIYHKDYVNSSNIAVSPRVPKTTSPIDLLPKNGSDKTGDHMGIFISNRAAEGWNGYLQAASIGQIDFDDIQSLAKEAGGISMSPERKVIEDRYQQFKRMLTFGRDLPGAFWALDIDRDPKIEQEHINILEQAATSGRTTIAGAQPKLLGIKPKHDLDDALEAAGVYSSAPPQTYYPVRYKPSAEVIMRSTHILKLGSVESGNQGVIIGEYLAMEAMRKLLPDDEVQKAEISTISLVGHPKVPVLALERFDRGEHKARRHFTEMTELLGKSSSEKFDVPYWHMAKVLNPEGGIEGANYDEAKKLYKRVVGGFLIGNFDNHLKNFAVFNDTGKLTPNYDIECTEIKEFKGKKGCFTQSALPIQGKKRIDAQMTSSMLVELGVEMGVTFADMRTIFDDFGKAIPVAKQAIEDTVIDPQAIEGAIVFPIKHSMQENLQKRWDRYADIQTVIGDAEEKYKTRVNRSIDIPRAIQPSLYAQFAPERLEKIALVADKSGKPPIGYVPDGVFAGHVRSR
jgi:hypothetical protein